MTSTGQRPEQTQRPAPGPASHNDETATLNAEESLLGAMLLRPDAIAAALAGKCDAEHFQRPAHGHIFAAATSLYERGEPVDPVTVSDELRRSGLLDAIGDASVLVSLQIATPSPAAAAKYAEIVVDNGERRRALGLALELADAYRNGEDARAQGLVIQLESSGSRLGAPDTFASRLRTPDEVKAIPAPAWLLAELIVAGTLGLLWGPWGSMKTFLALAWSGFIGSGSWWQGRAVTQGKVLYVAAEGVAGLGRRIEAYEAGHRIYGMPGVTFHHGRIDLLDAKAARAFIEGVGAGGYSLVWLDTLARMMVGGDENSAQDVGRVVDVLDQVRQETGAAVWATHHSTKEGSSARGVSAYLGACDTELEAEADGQLLTVKCHQQRDAEKAAPFQLWLEPVPGTHSAVLLDPAGRRSTTPSAARLAVLAALDDDPERGVGATVWAATAEVPPTTFHRHRRELMKEGLVGTLDGTSHPRYVLTDLGRQFLGASGAT